MMDTRLLKPGEDFSSLAETYVIFITENDVMEKGLPLYHIDRKIEESDTYFGDGSHILYVNGHYEGDDPVGKLMHDFRCSNADDMNYSVLANRVRYLKQREGEDTMKSVLDEMREEIEKAVTKRYALRMLAEEVPAETISKCLEITLDEVKDLAEQKPA